MSVPTEEEVLEAMLHAVEADRAVDRPDWTEPQVSDAMEYLIEEGYEEKREVYDAMGDTLERHAGRFWSFWGTEDNKGPERALPQKIKMKDIEIQKLRDRVR